MNYLANIIQKHKKSKYFNQHFNPVLQQGMGANCTFGEWIHVWGKKAIPIIGHAETKDIPFTLDDRDRIIRTEQKDEALNTRIDAKLMPCALN